MAPPNSAESVGESQVFQLKKFASVETSIIAAVSLLIETAVDGHTADVRTEISRTRSEIDIGSLAASTKMVPVTPKNISSAPVAAG